MKNKDVRKDNVKNVVACESCCLEVNDDEVAYPCKQLSFACPERDNCNTGQHCPWKK